MYSSLSAKSRNRANPYLVNDIMESSQEKLLLKLYDFAITNCRLHNIEKTNKALNELIFGLRFDETELEKISSGLFQLYNFCKDQMRKHNYEIVEKILSELKETWEQTLKANKKI
ncbi:MAG: flagellar protein FliS [Melioribacteraceae bacterium]|jgi:flagellin-specific chaperone FliS|nr:flagellar protein FliS [Melioribacteraceae bacterium]RJP56726.1 MAG: flagellar protein FliS [Ignavibacteriales bacterium]WKZ70196.1 MAG: flagellar protein FliS [Melioribacteraceae bacterium]